MTSLNWFRKKEQQSQGTFCKLSFIFKDFDYMENNSDNDDDHGRFHQLEFSRLYVLDKFLCRCYCILKKVRQMKERTSAGINTMLVHKKTQRQVQWTIQETQMFVLQQLILERHSVVINFLCYYWATHLVLMIGNLYYE